MEKNGDFYAVLGLKKECSDAELKNAYKKLALRWHPDRCSAKANSKTLQESKEKFQQIQAAYAVLSDSNKRFLYDVGVYDSEDDNDETGMGDFMDQMARMMSQTQPSENGGGQESLEDLHQLFVDMFQDDDFFAAAAAGPKHVTPIERSSSLSTSSNTTSVNSPPARSFSLGCNKRGAGKAKLDDFDFDFDLAAATATFGFESFDYGESFRGRGGECKRRAAGPKQKSSSKQHNVSSS